MSRPDRGYRRVDEATSRRLASVGQRDTAPELAVRRILTRLGLRYRTTNRDLPGAPDVANRAGRWAVFVHGCYWHSHRGCPRATVPARNRALWVAKFERTVERDRHALGELARLGFATVVVWECELDRDPEGVARRLAALTSHLVVGHTPSGDPP